MVVGWIALFSAGNGTAMLWAIAENLVVLWLLGLLANFGGGLIHILLVIALIVMAVNLLRRRRASG